MANVSLIGLQAAAEYAAIVSRGLSTGFRQTWRTVREFALDNFYVIIALAVLVLVVMAFFSPRVRGGGRP